MPKTTLLEIRPLEPADVPALLTIIADTRREYGIAEHGVECQREGEEYGRIGRDHF